MLSRTERLQRMTLLLDDRQMNRLQQAHVMLLGLGGVGSYAAEALARAGVGAMTLVDGDSVAASNLNRQLPALRSTVGRRKTEVVRERLLDAAPDMRIDVIDAVYLPDSPVPIPQDCDMVLDAIDTISAKIDLAVRCQERGLPLVSCMGMGNRLDPTQIRIGDLYETAGCPLCRVMRRELRRRGVDRLCCVYSLEAAHTPRSAPQSDGARPSGRPSPGSVSFVPSVAGLYMAYEAVRRLVEDSP